MINLHAERVSALWAQFSGVLQSLLKLSKDLLSTEMETRPKPFKSKNGFQEHCTNRTGH